MIEGMQNGDTGEPNKKGLTDESDKDADMKSKKEVLLSATDPDTMRYVMKLAEDESAYNKLSDEDKSKARCFMFASHVAMNSK